MSKIDLDKLVEETSFDFTKPEVMEKYFDGQFKFDEIIEAIDKALKLIIKAEMNGEVIEYRISDDDKDEEVICKMAIENRIDLLCKRKQMYEYLKEYKNVTRGRYKSSTKDVERQKAIIKNKFYDVYLQKVLTKIDVFSALMILKTKEIVKK